MDDARTIAAARRKARRMARSVPDLTYHQALDELARDLGRSHWSAYLASPVAVPRDVRDPQDARGPHRFDVPIVDKDFLRRERVALFAMTATTVHVGTDGNRDAVEEGLARFYPGRRVDFLETTSEMIDSYVGSVADGASGR